MNFDLFISYSSADRPIVEKFVLFLKSKNFSIFYDRDSISIGKWGDTIANALEKSSWVISFLSENSYSSGYVFAESDYARKKSKLIPIIIDKSPIKFEFEGLTALIQRYNISSAENLHENDDLNKICEVIKNNLKINVTNNTSCNTFPDEIRRHLDNPQSVRIISYITALSFFENNSYDLILTYENALFSILNKNNTLPNNSTTIYTKKNLLNAILAETWNYFPDKKSIIGVECARFINQEHSSSIIEYIWTECDYIKPSLLEWLNSIIENDEETWQSVALNIGILAQTNFYTIFNRIIMPWARSHKMRRVADMALAVATLSPSVSSLVENSLLHLSKNPENYDDIKILLLFSCGYTGLRIPSVSISTLHKLAELTESSRISINDKYKIRKSACHELREFIERIKITDRDNNLFDFAYFVYVLSEWVNSTSSYMRKESPLPHEMLIISLESVSISNKKIVNMHSLLSYNLTNMTEMLSKSISNLLSSRITQKSITDILSKWIMEVKNSQDDHINLLTLTQHIYRNSATERDRERVVYIFRDTFESTLIAK